MKDQNGWALLAKIFGSGAAEFRHRMGLFRLSANDFYAVSEEHEAARAEKQQILHSQTGDQYLLESDEGWPLFQEWVSRLGPMVERFEQAKDHRRANLDLSLVLEPDYLLLSRSQDGWRLVWASVCFPTRWSLTGKQGHILGKMHEIIPGLNAQLGRHIDVFFDHLLPGEGWGRANWGLSTDAVRNQHPSLPYEPLTAQTELANVHVRLESQHFDKLPKTGAIVFGIRIIHLPLLDVMTYSEFATGLREQLRTMPADVAVYKGIPTTFWQRL